MKCEEPLTVSQLKELIDEGSWSDSALSMILDGATDFLFALLGHSFGRAIRIYHDESYGATAATVQVVAGTGGKIALTITGGTKAAGSPYEYEFDPYSDMIDLVDIINQADTGFVATLVEGMSPTEETTNLHTLAATDCFGLSARRVLCIEYTTETMDGTGEGYIFTQLPIRSVSSLTQDGTAISSSYYWAKTGGYVLYKYCSGSQYQKYSLDLFSLKAPCNIVLCYTPLWLRIPGFFKLILRAMCQFTLNSSGYEAEGIGDYHYKIGDISKTLAPWWPMIAEYTVSFSP